MIDINLDDIGLTPREHQVFLLTALGNADKQVGGLLGIEQNTANNHRKHLTDKFASYLGFRPTPSDLVQIALALDLIKNRFRTESSKAATATPKK